MASDFISNTMSWPCEAQFLPVDQATLCLKKVIQDTDNNKSIDAFYNIELDMENEGWKLLLKQMMRRICSNFVDRLLAHNSLDATKDVK